MPQIINTNIASLNAQRNLNKSQSAQDTALQRLSSGLRINSAKDDAAGLAISTRFDAQIRGTSVAIRNSGDAISLSQTAEGSLNSITTSLQRIRELALQSANDTNTDVDRDALQQEVDQLVEEIQNVAENSNFNGKKLLDGSFQNAVFQTGANAGENVTVSISRLDADTLGSATQAGISSTVDTAALTGSATSGDALVAGDIVINGVSIGGSVGSDDNSSVAFESSSSIAKAAAINEVSDQTGVVAVVDANVLAGVTTADAVTEAVTISINDVQIDLSKSTQFSVEQNLQANVDAINAKSGLTGVVASTDGTVEGGIKLTSADGRNITLGGTAADSAASFGLAATGSSLSSASLQNTYVGTYTLISEDGSDIAVTSDTGNIDNAGFEVGTFSGTQSGSVGDNVTAGTALTTGDLVINGVAIGPSLTKDDTYSSTNEDSSAIAKAAAINRVSDQTDVTAVVNENRINSGDLSVGSSYSLSINGVTVNVSLSSSTDTVADQLQSTIDAVNSASGQTGVTAVALDSDSFTLVAADGRNIDLSGGSSFTGILSTTYASSITLLSGGSIEVGSNTGNVDVAGFRIGSFGNGETGTALGDLDITTAAGAEAAVLAVDNALQTITSKQAELGAIQNRFENTISNLEATNENLSSAKSRILDADFASETASLSRAQVLQQAGISILAQANARPQQVLSLLQ
ncbi:flagellin [Hahella sp. CCB-MM4]|uniref:flagellin N-terminal helical domain-containing protein n=1 Tax=Hahella sp. (strain CCB-MM4) TaxID=1926491 RepID=UPI000B9A94FA|nr:flagellin [Hahella sp. CCB-MM4]OZG73773.1 flagellin [Hahella sp. CCB-MM4]